MAAVCHSATAAGRVDLVIPVPASIAHPLIEGLRNEAVVQDDAAKTVMPVPLTPFDRATELAPQHGQGAGAGAV